MKLPIHNLEKLTLAEILQEKWGTLHEVRKRFGVFKI